MKYKMQDRIGLWGN